MSTKALWFLKCIGYCLLAYPVIYLLSNTVTHGIWWCLDYTQQLSQSSELFLVHYYLFFVGLYGTVLGLIPTHRLRGAFHSLLANFRTNQTGSESHDDYTQPQFWAWLPIGSLFLLRFITWIPSDHSVIATSPETRFEYFFQVPDIAVLPLLSPAFQKWVFDRYILTGPTLFLLAYAFGLWFRNQWPSYSHLSPSGVQEASEIPKDVEGA